MQRRVVAVAGPVGGGKTSLVRGLLARLPDADAVFLDHWETFTQRPLEELEDWIRAGAEIDAIEIPRLAGDLARLRSGASVTDPATGATVRPAQTLLFETLYGRAHSATGRYVDLVLWVDTPLDVALARNVAEFARRFAARQEAGGESMRWLQGYLETYLRAVRPMLLLQRERVARDADVVLDGRLDPESLVREAERELRRRLSGPPLSPRLA